MLPLCGEMVAPVQMRYTIFGLGDTQYKHFNQCGKDTEKFLRKFGAQQIFERGEGDADRSMDGVCVWGGGTGALERLPAAPFPCVLCLCSCVLVLYVRRRMHPRFLWYWLWTPSRPRPF